MTRQQCWHKKHPARGGKWRAGAPPKAGTGGRANLPAGRQEFPPQPLPFARLSPLSVVFRKMGSNFCVNTAPKRRDSSSWQSNAFVTRRSWVRFPFSAQNYSQLLLFFILFRCGILKPIAFMIKLTGVSKIYSADSVALRDVNLAYQCGRIYSIVGQSGTGKTTLAKLLLPKKNPPKAPSSSAIGILPALSPTRFLFCADRSALSFRTSNSCLKKNGLRKCGFCPEVAGEKTGGSLRWCPRCWRLWVWGIKSIVIPISFRAANNSGWLLRALWCIAPKLLSLTNPPAIWTPLTPRR